MDHEKCLLVAVLRTGSSVCEGKSPKTRFIHHDESNDRTRITIEPVHKNTTFVRIAVFHLKSLKTRTSVLIYNVQFVIEKILMNIIRSSCQMFDLFCEHKI